MHRSSKRIVTPLFLLLVAAAIFVPEVRGDELVNFNLRNGESFTLPQDAVPDRGSVAGGDFQFLAVPVGTHTFDVNFFFLTIGLTGQITTNFQLFCDPFQVIGCDYLIFLQTDGDARVWLADSGNRVDFIPGDYFFGTISVATPEPSTLALLLMGLATLFLLAAGVRPSHR